MNLTELTMQQGCSVRREVLMRRRAKKSRRLVCTYDRSNGVAGVDPLKLWAKVAPPPVCLAAGFCMAPELMGPTPAPKAQPGPLFTGGMAARLHQHQDKPYMRRQNNMGVGSVPLTQFPVW